MTRHRWGDKVANSPNKTERECTNGCGIVKVTRHESEGGLVLHLSKRDYGRLERLAREWNLTDAEAAEMLLSEAMTTRRR